MGVNIPTTKRRNIIGPYTIKKEVDENEKSYGVLSCITDHLRGEYEWRNQELNGLGVQYHRQHKTFQCRIEGEYYLSVLNGFGKIMNLTGECSLKRQFKNENPLNR